MLKWEQFLALDSFAHLQTRSTMYVSQLGQQMVLPLHTSLLTSRSVKTRTGTGRGFFLSSLKQPTFLQFKAQPVSSNHKIVHVNRAKRQTREKFPCTIHWPGYKTQKRKWILSEELMIKRIKNICEIKQTKAVAVRDFFFFQILVCYFDCKQFLRIVARASILGASTLRNGSCRSVSPSKSRVP